MNANNFSEIGNLGDFRLEHQRVKNYGLLITPSLVLKLYQITKQSEFEPKQMEEAKSFLEEEIKRYKIEPLTGMGFAIQSTDMLNVVRWDTEFPILMKNNLYQKFTKTNIIQRMDINELGPFCIWEDTIVGHERIEWIKYLKSNRTDMDKKIYFSSFIKKL